MNYSNIQLVKKYIQDDEMCRKNIGMESYEGKNLGKDVKNSDYFLIITVAY